MRFYVVNKTNWGRNKWYAVAGPFPTLEDARAEAPKYEVIPVLEDGRIDQKHRVFARAVGRADLALYGYPLTERGEKRLAADLEKADAYYHYDVYTQPNEWDI